MTIEEAIETIQYASAFNSENSPLTRALDMAISALRTQQEAEKNEPLTLDELREMDGEQVYVVPNMGCGISTWAVVNLDFMRLEAPNINYYFGEYGYSRFWLAYRRPPEKGA